MSMLPELRSNSYLGQPMIEARQLRSNSHADLPSIYVQAPKSKGKQPQGPREEDSDLRDQIKAKKEQQRKYNEWKAGKDKQYEKEHGEPFRRPRQSKVAAVDEPIAEVADAAPAIKSALLGAFGGAPKLPTLSQGKTVGFAAVGGLKRAEGEFGSTSGEKGIGIFAMLAAAKFKVGGRKSHDAWLQNKAKEEEKKLHQLIQQAEHEVALEDQAKFESLSRYEQSVQRKLATETAMHNHLKKKLYREATLDQFEPERPDSGRGAIPLLDELKLASEEENWEVGIAICKLKDRLDEIAPGERVAAAKQKKGKARMKIFPQHLPPRPTRESVIHHIDNKELL